MDDQGVMLTAKAARVRAWARTVRQTPDAAYAAYLAQRRRRQQDDEYGGAAAYAAVWTDGGLATVSSTGLGE